MTLCQMTKPNGEACKTYAVKGSEYCFFHDPHMESKRKEATTRGGRGRPKQIDVLIVRDGHITSYKTGECILCGDDDLSYCPNAIKQDKLIGWMDKHPYVYVLNLPDNPAISDDYWWFGVRDTRKGESSLSVLFTSDTAEGEELPEP